MARKFLKAGAGLIIGTTIVSSLPTLGQPAAENLKVKFAEGAGKVGETLPTVGKIVGTGLVLKATGKLKKFTDKFKLKGGSI